MPTYRVTVDADFRVKAKASDDLTERLTKLFRREGFADLSFDVAVENVKLNKKTEVPSGP